MNNGMENLPFLSFSTYWTHLQLIRHRIPKSCIFTDILNWHTEYVEQNEGLKTEQKSRVMYMPCDTVHCNNLFRLYLLYFVQLFQVVLVLNENG
jgi:hypothetical protein